MCDRTETWSNNLIEISMNPIYEQNFSLTLHKLFCVQDQIDDHLYIALGLDDLRVLTF